MLVRYNAVVLGVFVGLLGAAACGSSDTHPGVSVEAGGTNSNVSGNASVGGSALGRATGGTNAASITTATGGATQARATGGANAASTTTATGGASGNVGGKASVGGATLGRATGGTNAASTTTATGGATQARATGGANAASTTTATGGAATASTAALFSFFVTSQDAMMRLSNSVNGFGGDLRYGMADGLSGADKICTDIAEASMPGSGAKGWRAFLSATAGPTGSPVNAIDRIGNGPWYDRVGRLVAANKTNLLNPRPVGGNAAIVNDLPNETGTPNHSASGAQVDNHDTLTGTNATGGIGTTTRANTCNDWTSSVGTTGKPQIGHSWPRTSTNGVSWYSDHTAPGCAPGVNTGSQNGAGTCVGCSGGYGGIFCFALAP